MALLVLGWCSLSAVTFWLLTKLQQNYGNIICCSMVGDHVQPRRNSGSLADAAGLTTSALQIEESAVASWP